jgi:plastocyanin
MKQQGRLFASASVGLTLAACLALAGCKSSNNGGPSGGGGGGGGQGSSVAIPLTDYGGSQLPSFSPTALTVTAGTSVTWQNSDTVTHTTTSDTNLWNASLGPGQSFSRTFSTAGTFTYACTVHSNMTGRIIVQ